MSVPLHGIALHKVQIGLSPKEFRNSVTAFMSIANTNTTGRYIGSETLVADPEPPTVQLRLSAPVTYIDAQFEVYFVNSTVFGAQTALLRATSPNRRALGTFFDLEESDDYGHDYYVLAVDIKLRGNDTGDHIIPDYVSSIADNGRDHEVKALMAMGTLLVNHSVVRRLTY